ncbi:MAG: helix-turn-helix domain-containing protein [Actinomycetota bacterium]|nr:helix-turn-helix domain-containing protein [Actinomycetota bacterium]
MTTDTYPTTLTIEEAGELLGLSRSSAYRAAARGELPTLRFGRRLIVPTGRLLAMLGLEQLPSRDGEPR